MDYHGSSDDGDAFALSDPWRLSKFTHEAEDRGIYGLKDIDAYVGTKQLELRLPDIQSFEYGPFEDICVSEASSISLPNDEPGNSETRDDDLWFEILNEESSSKKRSENTWESFYDRKHTEAVIYLSEAGPRVFDAALFDTPSLHDTGDLGVYNHVLRSEPIFNALLKLGMGRQSSFFMYDSTKGSFSPCVERIRLSGYSLESFESLRAKFITYGNQMVGLRSFVDETYNMATPCATRIAVAALISSISSLLLEHLWQESHSIQSLLQLQSVFDRPGQLLGYLDEMEKTLTTDNSDENILSSIFELVQRPRYTETWFRPVAIDILSSISRPWLESLAQSIGLASRGFTNNDVAFPRHSKLETVSNTVLDGSKLPNFIADQDRQNIIQARQSLSLLEKHSPDNVLSSSVPGNMVEAPRLEWHFGWTDIARIEEKAKKYEISVLKAMSSVPGRQTRPVDLQHEEACPENYDFDPFGSSVEKLRKEISNSCSAFEQKPPTTRYFPGCSSLEEALNKATVTDESAFTPPLAVAPLLAFSSIISVQTRLLNMACLRMLFKEHGLQNHLQLQRRFHLFGDSMFTSRLSHALFDPELASSERRKGHTRAGVLGLKLGSRDSWPPASSELRLALMGILTDTYNASSIPDKHGNQGRALPGGLSFAVRNISEEEIQKCMDPNSVEALDYLRLQYTAPSPLDDILNSSCMEKYDTIFKLLLRVTRMLFVVNQLSRSNKRGSSRLSSTDPTALRFIFEARSFVSCISEYFFDTVITSIWDRFEIKVAHIERMVSGDNTSQLGAQIGLQRLTSLHEEMLDSIMFALLLRKRQGQAMQLLEEIFGLILSFMKNISNGTRDDDGNPSNSSKPCHSFRHKVRAFIIACRGLNPRDAPAVGVMTSSQRSPGLSGHRHASQNSTVTIAQLLLKLEMNDYYSRPG